MKRVLFGLIAGCVLALAAASSPLMPVAVAADFVVVDTEKIFTESNPGKDAAAHLKKVQEVLQTGMDDLEKSLKGKEDAPETRDEILRGQAALQQQLAIEQQALIIVLNEQLGIAVKKWRAKNKAVLAVFPKQNLIDADAKLDMTSAVLTEMNKLKPTFPDLPKVTINAPAPTPANKK